jgi:hypothetical protein
MRARLRFALPVLQMALAVCLLWWAEVWFRRVGRFDDMPGPAPAFTLCISINAPIALARAAWFRHLSTLWDNVTLVLAVGILWYWVALNVESWRRDHTVLMFHWAPLRLVSDLLLIAVGVFWGVTFVAETRDVRQPMPLSGWLWGSGFLGPLLAWSLALIFFFGRDLVQCVRGIKPAR